MSTKEDLSNISLRMFKPYLEKQLTLDHCTSLAQHFTCEEIISDEWFRDFHDCPRDQKKKKFLEHLVSKEVSSNPKCNKEFANVLNDAGARHIVQYLTGENVGRMVLSERWEKIRKKHNLQFRKDFNPDSILLCYGKELFDEPTLQMLNALPTNYNKVTEFLIHVPKKPNWGEKLLIALKDERCGNMAHLAQLLDPEDNLQGKAFVNLLELCKNMPEFRRILNPDDILDHMECIPPDSKKAIRAIEDKAEKVTKFVDVITGLDYGWFKKLVAALLSCKDDNEEYEKLIDLLQPNHGVTDAPSTSRPETGDTVTRKRGESSRSANVTASLPPGGSEQEVANKNFPVSVTPATESHEHGESSGNADVKFPLEEGDTERTVLNSEEDGPRAFYDPSGPENVKNFQPCDGDMEDHQTPEGSAATSPFLNIPASPDPDAPLSIEESLLRLPTSPQNVSPDKPKEELKLRDYQLELAQSGLEGRNCMIVAPTGSGKTFVALFICKKHLEKTEKPKVILLVPRVPLVKQQFNLFKRFLTNDQKIFQVTGDMNSTVPVHILIDRHEVIVMTAQILVNLLNDGLTDITQITMLIFDECHHTVKNEPYNQIMRVYLDKRCEKKDAKLPQVVGLTASPGMGKAKTIKKANDNIKKLMANLDVTTAPVQVTNEKGDLMGFQHEAQDEIFPVYRQAKDSFFIKIKQIMQEIQGLIELDIENFENVLEGRIAFDLRAAPGTQDYEAWAVTLLNKSKLIKHEEASQRFMTYAEHLQVYNTSLMLNDHVRSKEANDYILDVLFKPNPKPIELSLQTIYDRSPPRPTDEGNPLLDALTEKLCSEFEEKPNSRCIIFVKTRAIARALLTYLTEQRKLKKYQLNPKQMTGAAAHRENFGMTKVGQDDNLSAFRQGVCKVLVATSVAEEGLDIKECNLIITYNYSTNEVGQVQRKGRGRAKDSKVVMLAYIDSGHAKRERENAIRVELTQDILLKLHLMNPETLEEEIRLIQKDLQKDREFEKAVETYRSRQKKANPGVFRLSCLWCKRLVTSSDKFCHINKQHRVVVDSEFDQRAEYKVVPDSEAKEIGDEQYLIGKIFCKNKNCQRIWGLRMRYKRFPISVLRIENFVITNEKGYRAVKKKWKDAPFKVEKELKDENLRMLVGDPYDPDDDEEEDDPDLGNDLNISSLS